LKLRVPHSWAIHSRAFIARGLRGLLSSGILSTAPARLTVLSALVLSALIVIGSWVLLANMRDRAIAESGRELANTSLILAKKIEHFFDELDTVQQSLIEKITQFRIISGENYQQQLARHEVHLALRDKNEGMTYVGTLAVYSPEGKVINFSRAWPVPDIDVSDQDFFKAFKSNPDLQSYLSEPVRSRANGNWIIHAVRKVIGPDGEFLALIAGTVELDYFQHFLSKITSGRDSSISLFSSGGVLLVRHPHVDADVGRNFRHAITFRLVENSNHGIGQSIGVIDRLERIIAAHRVERYPVVVAATVTRDRALRDWYEVLYLVVTVATITIASIIGFAVLFLRLFKSHQVFLKMQAERAESEKIHEQNVRFDTALNNMSQGLLMFDAAARLSVFNHRYIEIYKLKPEQVRAGMTLRELLHERKKAGMLATDPDTYCDDIMQAMATGNTYNQVLETTDGRIIHVLSMPMESGGWVTTHEDITERVKAGRERDESAKFLDLVINNVPATVIVRDAKTLKCVLLNRAGEAFYNIPREQVVGRTPHEILPRETANKIAAMDRKFLRNADVPMVIERPIDVPGRGTRIAHSIRLAIPGEDGKPKYLLTVVNDVTDARKSQEQIAHMAHHDALTDLPNRTKFMEYLQKELNLIARGRRIAVHYIDLDHFKWINDTLGHATGDELLKAVARRMHACLRGGDTIARLGGDEFAIVQTDVESPKEAGVLAERLRGAVSGSPCDVNGHQIVTDISVGISLSPDDSSDADQLLKNADMALYNAKMEGRGTFRYFEPELDARMKARRALEVDLRNALAQGQFELHYQPIVSISTGSISCFEALLRWRHPERGMVSPAEFVPVAEEIGLIGALGEWVLRTACAEAANWPSNIRVAVNLSPVQVMNENLVPMLVSMLSTTGLAPNRLELEITETVLLQSNDRTLGKLQQIRDLGVRVAVDDFGTGYSSLSYLRTFPLDKIKIDRSFIMGIVQEPRTRSIVSMIITLGNSLGMTTTAEGVETEEQLNVLREEGCAEMQGYLFSAAKPAADLVAMFPEHNRKSGRAVA
jgi:diguanylate cyclase (GGDEF)-like protein/PAS domain S-box-containing protein